MAPLEAPFYTSPHHRHAHVILFYRNLAAKNPCVSHAGLGINALHTARVLRRHRIHADVVPVAAPEDIAAVLQKTPTVTHALIEAPWVVTPTLQTFALHYPHVHFIVRCHSQIGFLQVEAGAIQLLREDLALSDANLNVTVAGNSRRFCDWITSTYRTPCPHLPNLYNTERTHPVNRNLADYHKLKIASFGAIRLLKNHTTAAAAAQIIAEHEGCDLDFYISVNREEHGKGVVQALRNMFAELPWATLVEVPWQPWATFRHTVASMDLCLQMSATETFNLTIADAVSEGVPAVVSSAVEWVPADWIADIDDASAIARVGRRLLRDRHAAREGLCALERYMRESTAIWVDYLDGGHHVH